LLDSGNCCCPLLELEVLLLNDVLKEYNYMDAGVHLLAGKV
jgi:hypothetical protein